MLLLFHPAWWAHETSCRASLEESLRWDVTAALMALWHSFQIGGLCTGQVLISPALVAARGTAAKKTRMCGWFQDDSRHLRAQIAKFDVECGWFLLAPVLRTQVWDISIMLIGQNQISNIKLLNHLLYCVDCEDTPCWDSLLLVQSSNPAWMEEVTSLHDTAW